MICNHLQALASLLPRGYEQYYVNFIPVKLFAFSRVFQDRLSGCTFLISAHNQFKPMGRVRNTESHSEKKGYSIFTFKRISVVPTSKKILSIHGKLIYWEMIQNFFERNLVDLSWKIPLSTIGLGFNEDKICGGERCQCFAPIYFSRGTNLLLPTEEETL